jgi:hypothetical protein
MTISKGTIRIARAHKIRQTTPITHPLLVFWTKKPFLSVNRPLVTSVKSKKYQIKPPPPVISISKPDFIFPVRNLWTPKIPKKKHVRTKVACLIDRFFSPLASFVLGKMMGPESKGESAESPFS